MVFSPHTQNALKHEFAMTIKVIAMRLEIRGATECDFMTARSDFNTVALYYLTLFCLLLLHFKTDENQSNFLTLRDSYYKSISEI